jgi:transcriptional regulator with XRE-family HTH domain
MLLILSQIVLLYIQEVIKLLGDKIKQLRRNKNLTQKELADKLDIAQSTVGMIERNERGASNELLIKISHFFDVSLDYLLDDKIDNNLNTENKSDNNNAEFSPKLSVKEQEKLDKQAEELINELTISLSQNKDHLTDKDYDVLLASMKGALQAMTIRNKKKYTPKKYRNKN